MAQTAVKEFVRAINDIDRSKHRSEVFRDFCELAYCALAKKASPFADQQEALEKQYMEVVGRYRNKDDVRKMPELLAIAVTTISGGGCDFLGMVAGELGVLDAKLGQYFTPYDVSKMMAKITLPDVKKIIGQEGFMTIEEPAAGAGGMLLAVADTIEDMGFNLETSVWIRAVELSRPTYHMAYIQLTSRGLAGEVVCGNSLSLEIYTRAYTAAVPVFIAKNGPPFAKQRAAQEHAVKAAVVCDQQQAAERATRLDDLAASKPKAIAEQLSLFD